MDSETRDALELIETVAVLFALVGSLWAGLFIALGLSVGLSVGVIGLCRWLVEVIFF